MTNDELRAIAEAATPGPWEEFHDDPEGGTWCLIQTDSIGLIREDAPVVASSVTEVDARHIASFDPRRALAACDLADALDALCASVENWNASVTGIIGRAPKTGMGTDAARDALARWEAL